jgi:hypothetical protein
LCTFSAGWDAVTDSSRSSGSAVTLPYLQVTWIVCRKFHFQCFNYLDSNGKGTMLRQNAVTFVPATAFVAAEHLGQLIVTDGMPREGKDSIFALGPMMSQLWSRMHACAKHMVR